jgi:GT2 family glycosyltransferase
VREALEGGAPLRIAIVAIGRNEASRLSVCLDAALHERVQLVYVDSGSTDGSQALAHQRGVPVVELDPALPFTAARARNEGLAEVLRRTPGVEVVQFVDGDCELVAGWIARAARALASAPGVAAVCGRVRERERDRSIYNLLCDVEWGVLASNQRSCGGNAMVRTAAFQQVGGFDPTLIAGEEAELCIRLRARGWDISSLPDDMVLHDASMVRFGQWWRRALRTGWSYAEGAALHGASAERHALRENASIFFWGALLPIVVLGSAWATGGASLVLLGGYAVLAVRIYLRSVRAGLAARVARLHALFTVVGKVPQAIGQGQFVLLRALGSRRRVVDWRTAP